MITWIVDETHDHLIFLGGGEAHDCLDCREAHDHLDCILGGGVKHMIICIGVKHNITFDVFLRKHMITWIFFWERQALK